VLPCAFGPAAWGALLGPGPSGLVPCSALGSRRACVLRFGARRFWPLGARAPLSAFGTSALWSRACFVHITPLVSVRLGHRFTRISPSGGGRDFGRAARLRTQVAPIFGGLLEVPAADSVRARGPRRPPPAASPLLDPRFRNMFAPFGGPRGGAGARVTRASGRPRWVETRFGRAARPAPGVLLGDRIWTHGNYAFPFRRPARASARAARWLRNTSPFGEGSRRTISPFSGNSSAFWGPTSSEIMASRAPRPGLPARRARVCARPLPRNYFRRRAAAPRGRRRGSPSASRGRALPTPENRGS